jgi:hypothetical protein
VYGQILGGLGAWRMERYRGERRSGRGGRLVVALRGGFSRMWDTR